MPTKKKSLWRDEFYVRAYELAARGMNKTMIRKDLGVGPETWHRWNKTRPALRDAVEKGHKAVKDRETALSAGPEPFSEYIYRTLPPDLLPLWKALDVYKDEE